MLTISKQTLFSPDGLAARGQCNPDSPGWQLRWFDRHAPPVAIWQGAYKTCRHLQANCAAAATLDEVRGMVEKLLNANAFSRIASQPTDAYPTPAKAEKPGAEETVSSSGSGRRKKKKKKQ